MHALKAVLLFACLLVSGSVSAEGLLGPAANPPDQTIFNYRTEVVEQDEFFSGNNTAGSIGKLGWSFTGGTAALQTSAANHPGVMRRSTSASSGTLASFYQYVGVTAQWAATDYDLVWVVKLVQVDANTSARWGAFSSFLSNPPADGAFFERLDADTNFFCVSRLGADQTGTHIDSGVVADTGWHRYAIHRRSTSITFEIDGVPVCGVMTTNISTAVMQGATQIVNSTAADKSIDHDYYEIKLKVTR